MNKSDIALWISVVSEMSALASVWYTRRIAINDSERMKRKPLVFEINSAPSKEYDGWHSVHMTIRNFEPVAAGLVRLRLKKRGKLLPSKARWGSDLNPNPWDPVLETLPGHKAKDYLDLSFSIEAQGHGSSLPGSVSSEHLHFYCDREVVTSDFAFEWEWADGAKH